MLCKRCCRRVVTGLLLFAAGTACDQVDSAEPLELGLQLEYTKIQQAAAGLSSAEKDALARKRARFQSLTAEQQDRLRKMHQELASDPRAEQLWNIMRNYKTWLASLPPAQQAELRDLPTEERVARIRKLQSESTQLWLREYGSGMKPADATAMLRFMGSYVETHRSQLEQSIPPFFRNNLDRVQSPTIRNLVLLAAVARNGRPLPNPDPDELVELEKSLSPPARQSWDEAKESGDLGQLVQQWLRAVIQRPDRFRTVPRRELERFYLTLPLAKRDQLNLLPPEEMQARLTRMYVIDQVGEVRIFGRGNRRGPPEDGRRRPDRPPHRGDNPPGVPGRRDAGDRHPPRPGAPLAPPPPRL